MAATYRRIDMKALTRYRIMLLGEQRHIGVNNSAQGRCPTMQRPGTEPMICPLRVRLPNHHITEPPGWGQAWVGRECLTEGRLESTVKATFNTPCELLGVIRKGDWRCCMKVGSINPQRGV